MAITIKHAKTDTITDWTQTDLDAQIALGNFPPGTTLADIVLPSDWNDDHTFTGTLGVSNGGTGATTLTGYVKGNGTSAFTASSTIPNTDVSGLGTMATQNANNVTITGGSISGATVSGYIPTTEKGVANGVATLDSSGKVPVSQIPALGDLNYQGTWDAATNSPTLTSSVGTKGYYYVVNVAGSTNLNGITDWQVGDWAVYNGSAWQKIDNTDAVTSVNGYTGTVVLNYSDVGAFPATSTTGSGNVVLATGATQANPTISNYENFTPTTAPSYLEGRVWYDSTEKALAFYNDSSALAVHVSQDLIVKVINNTGSTIPNGSPVYITGTSSGQTYPNVALAKADVAATSSVIGLTNGAIANGAIGYVSSQGTIDNVNTSTFTVGQVLYLSPYSAGQLMNTIPPTGITVQVGVATYIDSSAGHIYVKQTTPLSVPASIITGTLGVDHGGTGQASALVAGGVMYGSSTTAMGVTAVGTSGQVLTSNGASAPTWTTPTTGTVTSVTGTAPIASTGGATPAISISQATTSTNGYLSSTDWNTFNNKGSGTVTSVAVTAPSIFSVAGSPITSSGTIALTYSGTALPIANGGTGQTTASAAFNALSPLTTSGDILYGATSGAGTRLGIGTTGQVLTVVGGLPAWSTISSGSGTVTSVSVVSANGFAGTVATSTTTPAITLTTSITGVLKGNGTAISAATSGTDYSAGTSALATGILKSTTTTGALSIAVAADFPTLNQNTTGTAANVTGTVAVANGGTGLTSTPTNGQIDIGNGTGFTRSTLTAGTGVSISNGSGSVTITNSAPSISWQSVQTGNFTATAGSGYPVNTTSGSVTVTLPASPSAGNIITIVDYAGTAATNNIIISPNGNKINASTSSAYVSTNREGVNLVYIDSTQGWILYADTYASTTPISQPYTTSYVSVAGGGGGGGAQGTNTAGGGGGAGGYLSGTFLAFKGTVYTVTIGAGGAGSSGYQAQATSGTSTTVTSLTTAVGGGAGAGAGATAQNGGSGGGTGNYLSAPSGVIGTGTSGQGNNGGQGVAYVSGSTSGGGGGGATAVGANGVTTTGGNGGAGATTTITGSSVTLAGGGGAAGQSTAGTGGSGGGGNGGTIAANTNGANGTANTGGGGGGAGAASLSTIRTGGTGGSGVVYLSVPTANYSATTTGSPTVTTSGSNTIMQFTSSGSYTA